MCIKGLARIRAFGSAAGAVPLEEEKKGTEGIRALGDAAQLTLRRRRQACAVEGCGRGKGTVAGRSDTAPPHYYCCREVRRAGRGGSCSVQSPGDGNGGLG